MAFDCSIIGFSPSVPRNDLWTQPEGGAARAEEIARTWLKGFRLAGGMVSAAEAMRPGEHLAVANGDPTVVFAGNPQLFGEIDMEGTPEDEAEGGIRMLAVRAATEKTTVMVQTPNAARRLAMSDAMDLMEMKDGMQGPPLPFEQPFWNGEHLDPSSGGQIPFRGTLLGAHALLWMFGLSNGEVERDSVIGPYLERGVPLERAGFHLLARA